MNDCSTDNKVCPICNDSGWEQYSKGKYEYYRECRCGIRQRQITKNRLSFANIPESFKEIRLGSFNTKVYQNAESRNKSEAAVKAVNYWINSFDEMAKRGMGLYLYSETKGSGKTRMAASIANELIHEKNIQVKFATSLQILNEIKASWDKRNNQNAEYTESNLLSFLSTTKVLIIDDFGTEQARDWIGERFYQIINNRYVDKKITIFTSNSRLGLLKYDDRITNRVKERTFQIPFPEESVREIISKQNIRELVKGIKDMEGDSA